MAVTHVMGYTITVDPIEFEAGKSTNLVINLSNTETNLTAYQMFLYLPSGVTVQKKNTGKYAFTANQTRHDGNFTFSVKDAADGSILISCFSADKDVLTGTSGELIRLPIEVASTVTTSLQGSIKNIEFTDISTQAHKIANVNFAMTMEGIDPPAVTDEVTISVPDMGISAGGSADLIVNMQTSKTNLTAYQMFLYLPSGVTVQKKANGKYDYTANADRHDGSFTISVKDAADGSILISCFSADKDVLTGTNGELIRLPIEVASTVTTSLQGSIKNIEFTDVSTQAHRLADVQFNMSLTSGVSGINFADADVKALCVSNWDINGDGELSIAEAAAATNEQFAALSFESVTADKWTFDELQYFTGLTVLNTKLAETKISSVKIPVTVTEIGSDAFRKTLLTSITLPDAVKKVGERAFAECGELVTADLGNVEEIEVNAFIATSIVNLTIPGTVKTVGLEPFSWNWTMKQATLEEGVTKVPETMFHGNVNLTTVSLPSTLTTIESRAFQQCEALTTILIPAGVTTIDEQAFNKCTSLVEVTVANPNPVAITEEVFSNRKNATLYVPDGCVDAYKTADYWKEFKKILVVGTTEQVNETDITQMPNAIYMESVTGRAGRKFWADLKLKNESGIRAYNFDLQLPVGVTIATDEEGNYIYEHGNRHEGAELNLNYNEASSTYYMSVIDNMAAGNGTIWRLSLKVADGLTLGNYPIVVTNVKYTPADGQDTQNIPDVTSILTVEEHGTMKGDANDDDIVNIADVVSIVNHSIHLENAVFIESSADVTGNGEADLTDAVRIIDYIVGRIDDLTSAPAASRALKASALSFASSAPMMTQETKTRATASAPAKAPDVSELTNAIYADDLSVKPGETCQLAISLKNAKTTNGYQFQLELPEGVTIPKDEKDKYACELSTRHNGHIVDVNYKDGAYKVVVYSMSSKALTGNDGEILTVQLQAADAMANDIYTVSIKEAAYSLVSGLSVSLPKADITLSVNNSLKGDANGDGNVNIADAISIVDHLLGRGTSTFNEAAADVNGDGVVDIADAVAIVNKIIK
jgi:hypothetical protein